MDNKKTIIASIIGVALLVVLVVGATFAYFTTAVTNDDGETLVTGKTDAIGSIALTNPTSNLHITLSALDMAQSNLGAYYATNDSTKNYDTEEVQREIAVATLTGGEATTHYECTTTINLIRDPALMMVLQPGDAYIQFGGVLTDKVDLTSVQSSFPVTFKLNGTDTLRQSVSASFSIVNRNVNQNAIAGKNFTLKFLNDDLECKVVENSSANATLLAQAVTDLAGQSSGNGNVLNENGIRYQGANPNNYIEFNNETWRIIGVFDGYTKIIRSEPLGGLTNPTLMKWSNAETMMEASNKWSDSLVYAYLRDTYYSGLAEKSSVAYYTNWRLGGLNTDYGNTLSASNIYTKEGNTTYSGNPLTMSAHIGLMNASDYAYASLDCYATGSPSTDCTNSNWLFLSSEVGESTISQYAENGFIIIMVNVSWSYITSTPAYTPLLIRPVVYLNSDVKVTGDGSINNKYTIVS